MNFDMWGFQKEMIKTFHENRFVITKCPRQVGKTTTSVAYLLWLTLFEHSQNIAVLANKGSLARDILSKYQLAYENLPMWMQQGVITWNKGNVELENGSKIIAASTSSSAVRGGSFNCVDGDSITTAKINGNIFDISLKDLYELIANSSIYVYNHNNGVDEYVHVEQIHKLVQQISEERLYTNGLYQRETSHNSKKYGWNKRFKKFSISSNETSHSCTQTIDKNDARRKQEENDLCIFNDDSYENNRTNEHERLCVDEGTVKNVSERSNTFRENKNENIKIQKRAKPWYQKTKRVWRKTFESINGQKEIDRTYGKNQQESRENKKDCGKTPWNEKNGRIKTKNERCEKELCSLEQRKNWSIFRRNLTENERCEVESIQILTENGFKNFDGVKKTKNQQTIKLITDNNTIVCTPDHKIYTSNGYLEARYCLNKKVLNNKNKYELVQNIIDGETIDVYDLLEVEDTHSYFCNNILVHQCVFLDEFAFVPQNIAHEFFNSVYPVISSGKTTKIIIVSTPNGMNLFYKLWVDAINKRNGYKTFEIHWSMVPGRDEKWKEETIRNTSEEQFRQEFSCEFLGSTNTLISGSKLGMMVYNDPITKHENLDIYEYPIKGDDEANKDHIYAITVDVSEGRNLDASAFSVFDISTMPYKQVAKYNSSIIAPMLYPTIIYNTARLYNDAYVLVEINNTPQIADILHQELEYENLLKVATGNKKAQAVSAGFERGTQLGLRMSPLVKRIGCSNLKTLIESDKLLVHDFDTISQLTTFVSVNNTFKAEETANDDLVMTLVLFAWLSTQNFFREIVNHDLRRQMQLEMLNQSNDDVPSFGIYDDGLDVPYIQEDGDVWLNNEEYGKMQNVFEL
jgi:hypothetical protein